MHVKYLVIKMPSQAAMWHFGMFSGGTEPLERDAKKLSFFIFQFFPKHLSRGRSGDYTLQYLKVSPVWSSHLRGVTPRTTRFAIPLEPLPEPSVLISLK